jgi:hypothetical protein
VAERGKTRRDTQPPRNRVAGFAIVLLLGIELGLYAMIRLCDASALCY